MSDELIKRLERWGEGASLSNHMLGVRSARQDCADAATALAEAQATIARLEAEVSRLRPIEPGTFLPSCECGMTGPCMWDQCKSPLLKTPPTPSP